MSRYLAFYPLTMSEVLIQGTLSVMNKLGQSSLMQEKHVIQIHSDSAATHEPILVNTRLLFTSKDAMAPWRACEAIRRKRLLL